MIQSKSHQHYYICQIVTFLLNFVNGIIHLPFLELENLKLVSQHYRAWSDCTDVQAGLSLLVAKTNHFQFQQVRVNVGGTCTHIMCLSMDFSYTNCYLGRITDLLKDSKSTGWLPHIKVLHLQHDSNPQGDRVIWKLITGRAILE